MNAVPTTTGLGQVSGSKAPIHAIGDWPVILGQQFISLPETLVMLKNPTSTLGGFALKNKSHFSRVTHEMNEYFRIEYNNDSFIFTPKTDTLRTYNGLDYVPLLMWLPQLPPTARTTPKQCNAAVLRRSNRKPTPSLKVRENNINAPSPVNEMPVNKNISQHRIQDKTHTVVPPSLRCNPAASLKVCDNTKNESSPVNEIPVNKTISQDRKQDKVQHVHSQSHNNISTQTSPITQFQIVSLMTHLKFACKNYQSLSHMSRSGSLKNMPSIKCPSRDCPACLLVKGAKLRRNQLTTIKNMKPGQLLMIDFAFFNVPSIRGYKSYLSITCHATGYTFTYPTHRKRAPVDIIKWHILALNRQGFIVNAVRFDEGGELARSYEVNQLLISLNVIMETTGGYSSHLNGKDERQHRTHAEAVRSMLYLAGLPESFWCLALAYHTFLQRRWCNYPETVTPYEKWHKNKPDYRSIHMFGVPVYVFEKDDRKLVQSNKIGIFLGYSSTTAVVIYQDCKTKELKRCHHARIDDYLQHPDTNLHFCDTPAAIMLRDLYATIDTIPPCKDKLTHIESPFSPENLFTYNVVLPPNGPLGLVLENDNDYGLPLVVSMHPDSPFVTGCKKVMTKNVWIISVHYEEPITVERFMEYVNHLREANTLDVSVTLSKRPVTSSTLRYQEFRSRFDQLRPITNKAHLPVTNFAIHSPVKPTAPANFKEFLASPYKEFWIKSMFERYTKFHECGTWSAPILRKSIPPDATVLDAVSTFKIKKTDHPTMWDLNFRPCSNGGPMVQGKDFDESHANTAAWESIRMLLALSSILGFRVFGLDISNAFQSTPREDSTTTPPIYMKCPPFYISWFNLAFPKLALDKSLGQYVVQLLVYMQGTKPASREFNILLAHLLAQINIYPTSIDSGVFVIVEEQDIMFLAIETDDILVCTNSEQLEHKIMKQIQSAFKVTVQKGDVISFLNYRIIQSGHGISVDQTPHILEMVDKFLGKEEKVTSTTTPLRSDKQFNEEVFMSVPATPSELKSLEKEFGHKFSTVYGALLHVATASRPDIANALNRLGVFQSGPNRLAFHVDSRHSVHFSKRMTIF